MRENLSRTGTPLAMLACARTVNAMLEQVGRIDYVRKADLRKGDRLLVSTENSVYSIDVNEDTTYSVSGGWFDSQGLSPARLSIAGCTWGGSVIKCDIVAACGLRLEFGNRVVTSRIREVRVVRGDHRTAFESRMRPVAREDLFRACYGDSSERSGVG
jgi:hypothetical protein